MDDPKAELALLVKRHPELKRLARSSRYIIWKNRASTLRLPGWLFWTIVIAAVIAAVVSVVVVAFLPDHSGSPCGSGSSWQTINVNSAARLGDAFVAVTGHKSKDGTQQSVTVKASSPRGDYHVIGVTDDSGYNTGMYMPLHNGSVTLQTKLYINWGGLDIGDSIVSADVCRAPGAG